MCDHHTTIFRENGSEWCKNCGYFTVTVFNDNEDNPDYKCGYECPSCNKVYTEDEANTFLDYKTDCAWYTRDYTGFYCESCDYQSSKPVEKKYYRRLVRDLIPDIIRKENKIAITEIISGYQLRLELTKKLVNEANHLLSDVIINKEKTPEYYEALADIQTLFDTLYHDDLDFMYVNKIRDQKKTEQGDFSNGIYLVLTEEKL